MIPSSIVHCPSLLRSIFPFLISWKEKTHHTVFKCVRRWEKSEEAPCLGRKEMEVNTNTPNLLNFHPTGLGRWGDLKANRRVRIVRHNALVKGLQRQWREIEERIAG